MAVDATGTPTTNFSIPTFDTANDAPSGLGSNAQMAAIDTALFTRAPKPGSTTGIGQALGWNGTAFTVVSAVTWAASIPTTSTNQALGWNGTDFTVVSTLDPIATDLAYNTFGSVAVAATTAAGATTIVTATAFTADGTSSYWIDFFAGRVAPDPNGRTITMTLWEGSTDSGTDLGSVKNVNSGGVTLGLDVPVHLRRKVTPAAGSRTYSVRAYVSGGTVGSSVVDGSKGPGYIRITKV